MRNPTRARSTGGINDGTNMHEEEQREGWQARQRHEDQEEGYAENTLNNWYTTTTEKTTKSGKGRATQKDATLIRVRLLIERNGQKNEDNVGVTVMKRGHSGGSIKKPRTKHCRSEETNITGGSCSCTNVNPTGLCKLPVKSNRHPKF